jgi:pimeloyl-ACP methyl ester carboxylesterase
MTDVSTRRDATPGAQYSAAGSSPAETLQIRIVGDNTLPTLIYLPGVHGDWTLVGSFRAAVSGHVRWVEFTYPRTLDWSLADYAAAVENALLSHGISSGWLLGESFGSQVAWALIERSATHPVPSPSLEPPPVSSTFPSSAKMQWLGLILAGGFVRHPMIWAVHLTRILWNATPLPCLRLFLRFYIRFAKFRHRHAPETLSSLDEFVRRRTALDQQAAGHRFALIAANDPRSIAERSSIPVYYLSGWLDPVVPWPFVGSYLRRHCPACRDQQVLWPADHNVLGTAPRPAARLVLNWMKTTRQKSQSETANQSEP